MCIRDSMHSALAVSEFDNMSKNVYHHTVVLFVLVNLLLKGTEQLFLLAVEHKRIGNTFVYDKAVKRSENIAVSYTHLDVYKRQT